MLSAKVYTAAGPYQYDYPVLVVDDAGGRPLRLRLDLFNHSPTGFAWGYGGSGPAQLALAILADALDDDARALRLHMMFKWRVISRLPRDAGFAISIESVLAHVALLEEEARNAR